MLPITENIDDLVLDFEEDEQENTQTFKIDTISVRTATDSLSKLGSCRLGELKLGYFEYSTSEVYAITGKIDELDAVRQSVYLILSTEADQYIIYPYTYGITTLDLIGKPSYYVTAVLPDRIREALLTDDRITDVSNFEFNVDKNKVHVTFVVTTIYGDVNSETVVTY